MTTDEVWSFRGRSDLQCEQSTSTALKAETMLCSAVTLYVFCLSRDLLCMRLPLGALLGSLHLHLLSSSDTWQY